MVTDRLPARNGFREQRLPDHVRRSEYRLAEYRFDCRGQRQADLRDAEVARLEILNEQLDSLFEQIPDRIDLFDRGISQGDTPRLWIDVVAHVAMGRDKRLYRFVQDTRFGRKVLAESHTPSVIVQAVTDYVARRMVEREHALVATPLPEATEQPVAKPRRSGIWTFAFGFLVGVAALFGFALFVALRSF